jgi:predicted GIY-YIG superfamily endonuclease
LGIGVRCWIQVTDCRTDPVPFGLSERSESKARAMQPFYLYMLRCADGSYYVGHTDNLEKRLDEHATGACGGYTAKRRPVTLVFVDEFASREDALTRELQLKGWSRAKKEALIRGDWSDVHLLAKRSARPSTRAARSLRTNGVRTCAQLTRARR